MALMQVEHVSKQYCGRGVSTQALRDLSLTIEQGELTAIVGSSGSGKSTLMNILGALDTPTEGRYLLRGEDVSQLTDGALSQIRNREIGFIFQGFNLVSGLNALENVELPLVYRGMRRGERRRLATQALEQVGLGDRLRHRPNQLSGGQQQRVAIARAIAARPPILLADEPTGNLDSQAGEGIMQILRRLHQQGRTVVIITHDPKVAESTNRQICLKDGRMVQDLRKSHGQWVRRG